MLPQNLRYGFRDYQLVTHSNIRGIYSRDEYNRLACSVSPTGSGKSFIGMGEIVQAGMGFDTDTSWLDSGSSIDENGIIAKAFTKVKAAENPPQMLNEL